MHIDIWAVASSSVVWTGNILESETRKSGVEDMDGWMGVSMSVMVFVSHVMCTKKHRP